MDKIVPPKRNKWSAIGFLALLLLAAGAAFWYLQPTGIEVALGETRTGRVERGLFRDEVVVRASAEPRESVILDSIESGRVEEIMVRDGALVEKGQLLFRLSNTQRHIELLARQAEHAQQISNLQNLRVAEEASRTDHQRRRSDIDYALDQAQKQYSRQEQLAARGFLSAAAMQEAADRVQQQKRALREEIASAATDAEVRKHALQQMDTAIRGLEAGLKLISGTVEALAVRAPNAGRLTGFQLQVGQTVTTGEHIGRIDDPEQFKLSAQIDEYYLSRVAVGRPAGVHVGDQTYPAEIRIVYPQVKEGRFLVELAFTGQKPAALSPGQSLDTEIRLSEPAQALILPNGPYINETGGAWVFVISKDGRNAERREITTGRRNNNQVEVRSGLAAGEQVLISSYAPFLKATHLRLTQ